MSTASTFYDWPDNDPARPCSYRYGRQELQCPNPVGYVITPLTSPALRERSHLACRDHLTGVLQQVQDDTPRAPGENYTACMLRARVWPA